MVDGAADDDAFRLERALDPELVAGVWRYASERSACKTILPDGCSDAVLCRPVAGRLSLFFTPLQAQAELKRIGPDRQLIGVRLSPAAVIADRSPVVADTVETALQELVRRVSYSRELDEALVVLRETRRPGRAAKQLGVQLRTLQRLTASRTGRSPAFWAGLARARGAAKQLIADDTPLCDLADAAGYSDQAHMTRALGRWFSATPRHIRRFGRDRRHPMNQLLEAGYDAVSTGEQISTR